MADKSLLHNKWSSSTLGGGSSSDLISLGGGTGSLSPSLAAGVPTVTFHFQSGLSREQVQVPVEKLTLKTLKDLASSFVNRKLNPDHGVPSLYERLMLFKHDYSTTNILRFINAASDIVDGTLIEVVVSSNYVPSGDVEFRPHTMEVHSYRSPTFCDYCGEMLFGLTHQGLKCKGCNQNYHKRCAYKVPNNCAETHLASQQRKYSTASSAMGASLTPSSVGSGQRRRSFNSASPTGSMKKNSTGGFEFDSNNNNPAALHGSASSMALIVPQNATGNRTTTGNTLDFSNLPQYHHQISAPPLGFCGDSVFLSISGATHETGTGTGTPLSPIHHTTNDSLLMVRGGGGAGGSSAPGSPRDKRSHSIGGRPLKIDQIMQARIKVPHTFLVHSYVKPTMCQLCRKLLKGLYKQGLQCKDCKFNCHKKCAPLVPADCTGEPPANVSTPATPPGQQGVGGLPGGPIPANGGRGGNGSSASTGGGSMSDVENESSPTLHQPGGGSGDTESTSGSPPGPGGINIPRVLIDRQASNETAAAAAAAAAAVAQQTSQQIPVQRLVQSIRQSKRRTSGVLKEGWVVHYTDRDAMRKRHFWRLDTKTITLYQSNTSPKYYKEIQLGEILAVESAPAQVPSSTGSSAAAGQVGVAGQRSAALVAASPPPPRYAFIMKVQPAGTGGGGERDAIIYHIGGESGNNATIGEGGGSVTGAAAAAGGAPAAQAAAALVVAQYDREWENAIRRALMPPVSPKSSATTTQQQQTATGGAQKAAAGTSGGGKSSNNMSASAMLTVNHAAGSAGKPGDAAAKPHVPTILAGITSESDISKIYQIFTDEVLGSGQFGVVYGGVFRQNGVKVAVKVIEKLRFPNKQEEQLKTEVAILQKLDHPGVVRLHSMFETPERIFVVMEKMAGDMLEMILSSERSRLNERITRFLIYQILSALRYLHTRDIVHCDLKPENVLLTSNADFPQTKLCDFGFARIIGEKSFRRSVVGTPAYLAPEVLRNKRYNRALDCWSVGVIVYVSLSGTFPFNEDEDISDQIQDAHFMFPPNPWQEITKPAIDLITRLLVVKIRERLTVAKALQHEWLQDYQLYVDLRRLEADFGWRFLTHESDDARWDLYRQKYNLAPQPAPPQKDYFMEKYYREADDYDENDNKQIKEE